MDYREFCSRSGQEVPFDVFDEILEPVYLHYSVFRDVSDFVSFYNKHGFEVVRKMCDKVHSYKELLEDLEHFKTVLNNLGYGVPENTVLWLKNKITVLQEKIRLMIRLIFENEHPEYLA